MKALLSKRGRTKNDNPGDDQDAGGESGDVTRTEAAPRRATEPPPAAPRLGEGLAAWWQELGGRRGGVGGFTTSASTRLFLVAILGAVVAGPVALLSHLSRPPQVAPAVSAAAPAVADVGQASRASSTATRLVRVWLSAGVQDRDRVADLVMVPPQSVQLPAVRPKPPTWLEVAAVDQTAVGEWRVLVQAGGGLAGPAATYLVLVQVNDTGAAAVSLPARVTATAPPTAAPPNLATIRLRHPAADAVSGFTTSLLTADLKLSRWVSPDSTLQPGPKACQAVTLTQVLSNTADPEPADGTELTVLATVTCTVTKATATRPVVAQPLQYPLVLRARDGRWEVVRYAESALRPANPTTRPSAAAPQLTTTPTSSPTGR